MFVFIASLVISIGISVLLYTYPDDIILMVLGVPLLLFGGLSGLVSIWGCDSCVTYMFGDGL